MIFLLALFFNATSVLALHNNATRRRASTNCQIEFWDEFNFQGNRHVFEGCNNGWKNSNGEQPYNTIRSLKITGSDKCTALISGGAYGAAETRTFRGQHGHIEPRWQRLLLDKRWKGLYMMCPPVSKRVAKGDDPDGSEGMHICTKRLFHSYCSTKKTPVRCDAKWHYESYGKTDKGCCNKKSMSSNGKTQCFGFRHKCRKNCQLWLQDLGRMKASAETVVGWACIRGKVWRFNRARNGEVKTEEMEDSCSTFAEEGSSIAPPRRYNVDD